MYFDAWALTQNALRPAPPPQTQGVWMEGAEGEGVCLSPDVHTLYMGATGFGKTTAMLKLARAKRRQIDKAGAGCMVFNDPKGEFAAALARPGDVILGVTHHWNFYADLLDGFDASTPFEVVMERAMELSGQLFAQRMKPGASTEQYFPKAARSVLAGLAAVQAMEALADPEMADGLDNTALLAEAARATPQRLLSRMAPWPQLESIRYHLYTDQNGSLNGESNGVLSEMTLAVREMFTGHWGRAGDFSVRRFIRAKDGRALFVPYDVALGSAQGPCVRAAADIALLQSMARDVPPGEAAFFLEELPILSHPPLESLTDALNLGRGSRVRVVAACQSVNQLYDLYGKFRADAMLAGFGQKIFFRANDAESAEYCSRLFGQTQKLEYTFNSRGERVPQPRLAQAVESWELSSLRVGDAVIGLNGAAAPFRFRFAP